MRQKTALPLYFALVLAVVVVVGSPIRGAADEVPAPPTPPAEALTPQEQAVEDHGSTAPIEDSQAEQMDSAVSDHVSPARVFAYPFMNRALITGLLVGAICGYLGLYVILKRIVFLGVALAEVSSAGVALGLALGINPFVGSIALMLMGVALLSVRWSPKRIPQDTFIGIGFAVASASAVLLVAASPKGEAHLLDIIFGNILTVTSADVWVTAIGIGAVALVHLLFAKEFLFTSADPETAATFGYNSKGWELLLYATIGLTIALAIHVSGVLMTFSSLILPATAALLISQCLSKCAVISVILGAAAVPVGLYESFVHNLPPSATIVMVGFAAVALTGIGRLAIRTIKA